MIYDIYFKRPLLWDYSIATGLTLSGFLAIEKSYIKIPLEAESISTLSDLTNISLTISGFILTLLTVLITFKGGSKAKKNNLESVEPLFEMFFSTNLYYQTVKHLKICIKSLILVAIVGFSLKLFLTKDSKVNVFYFNIYGLTVIALSLSRCLWILSKIIELQKENDKAL